MKVWKPNDPLTTLLSECQEVFVMYDIKVYCGLLQQKLTQFDFLSGMTFGSFSTDYYRLWITRRQKNYFFAISNAGVVVQRSNWAKLHRPFQKKRSLHPLNKQAKFTHEWHTKKTKQPLKTGKKHFTNTTNSKIISLGQASIYYFLPSFLN